MKRGYLAFTMTVVIVALGAVPSVAADKTVNITGTGTDAQYIEDGLARQLSVAITINDTVTWNNPSGNKTHTVTSDVKDATGKRLFDVTINPGSSGKIKFDQAMYDAAVKATG